MKYLFIPHQIHVGFCERSDTYTKKLGYVIYTDEKGVMRKQTSWDSWRDHKIEPINCENVPVEGFVLNKRVGGCKSGWNVRQPYCRVYDPRGFEIEITIENLLWILDWEDCLHGKGLTGKYVYGWDGKELVLIPCCTEDYTKSVEYSERLFNPDNTSLQMEMIPGAVYRFKNDSYYKHAYIGEYNIVKGLGKTKVSTSKRHVFYDIWDKSIDDKFGEQTLLEPYSPIKVRTLQKLDDVVENTGMTMLDSDLDAIKEALEHSPYNEEFWVSNVIDRFPKPDELLEVYERMDAVLYPNNDNKRLQDPKVLDNIRYLPYHKFADKSFFGVKLNIDDYHISPHIYEVDINGNLNIMSRYHKSFYYYNDYYEDDTEKDFPNTQTYHLFTLDTNLKYSVNEDLGSPKPREMNWQRRTTTMYPDTKISCDLQCKSIVRLYEHDYSVYYGQDNKCFKYIPLDNHGLYITKDGYIGNLHCMFQHVHTFQKICNIPVSEFSLPVKLNN